MRGASRAFPVLLVLIASATLAPADPRPFTYTYDLYPEGKGRMEFEQWATWKQAPGAEPGAGRFDFRQELEFGVTDNFDLSVYLPNWHVEDTETGHLTKFDSIGVEGVVYCRARSPRRSASASTSRRAPGRRRSPSSRS